MHSSPNFPHWWPTVQSGCFCTAIKLRMVFRFSLMVERKKNCNMGKLHEIQMGVHKEHSTAIHWPGLWLLLSSSGLVEAGSRCPEHQRPWSLRKGLAHPTPVPNSRHPLYWQEPAFILGFLHAGCSHKLYLPEVMESSQGLYEVRGQKTPFIPILHEFYWSCRTCPRTQRLWVAEPA